MPVVYLPCAGSGVFHSEYNHNKDKEVNLLQTWIFPNKHNVQPRYDQAMFAPEGRVNKLQALVSPIDNDDPGMKIHQDAWIYRSTLENGKSLAHTLHTANHGVYVFVINGQITVNGQQLSKRDAVGVSGIESVNIEAGADSDFIVFEVPMNY